MVMIYGALDICDTAKCLEKNLHVWQVPDENLLYKLSYSTFMSQVLIQNSGKPFVNKEICRTCTRKGFSIK